MHAYILAVGDELVSGLTVDTNSAWLALQLTSLGIPVIAHATVADQLEPIAGAIREAARRAEIILITGGLGPTTDDLTRDALAAALGEPLVEDAAALAELQAWFASRNRTMTPSNRVQAQRPRSATGLSNTCGTAPGLRAVLGAATIYVTPGVPREMKEMFERSIRPDLAAAAGDRITRTTKINTFGIGESVLGERIADLMARGGVEPGVTVGTTVHEGVVSVRIYATGTHAETLEQTARIRHVIHDRLGPLVFGENDETLAAAAGALLKDRGQTLATAESCTGGLLASLLTDTPGASAWFQRGWITYSNESKLEELSVHPQLLAKHGAVSEPVARSMAEGAQKAAHTDWALAITGIAGPDGGSAEKPVGTVWIALAGPPTMPGAPHGHAVLDPRTPTTSTSPTTPFPTLAEKYLFPGPRPQVRLRAAQTALAMLRFAALGAVITPWR